MPCAQIFGDRERARAVFFKYRLFVQRFFIDFACQRNAIAFTQQGLQLLAIALFFQNGDVFVVIADSVRQAPSAHTDSLNSCRPRS